MRNRIIAASMVPLLLVTILAFPAASRAGERLHLRARLHSVDGSTFGPAKARYYVRSDGSRRFVL